MLVSEIFYSIQGEGELTGVPSVFIRTAGCNLRCRWCDTRYASWHPEGKDRSLGEIVDQVRCFAPARHCVITGGEPMVARGIHDLAAALREENWHITLETAATVAPEGIACDLASLSPKLSNSTPLPGEIEDGWIQKHEERRLRPDVIGEWLERYPFQLKFVVTGPQELDEIEALLGQLPVEVPAHKLLLMPEAVSQEELRKRTSFLIDACKKRGYRFCHRLHIELFGNQRGT